MSKTAQRKTSYYKLGFKDGSNSAPIRYVNNGWIYYKDYLRGYKKGQASLKKVKVSLLTRIRNYFK